MEEKTLTLHEKLNGLLDIAKKKKNVLEEKEIQDYFRPEVLNAEQWDRIYDFLDANHVDVLRISADDLDMDEDLFSEENLDEEEDWILEGESDEQTYFDLEYIFTRYRKRTTKD